PRRHAALVEQRRDLAVGVIVEEMIDRGHDVRWRRPPRPGKRQRERACCAPLEADLQCDVFGPSQRHILDEQPRHSLAFAIWCAWIVPQTRKVGSKGEDAGALLLVETAFSLT